MNRILAESHTLARQWAPRMCWPGAGEDEGCAWYHGAWQTLRLLGIVTTLTHEAHLYLDALRALIATGGVSRIVIAGAADYGLLSVVLDAFARQGAEPRVTVVDRCATPLQLCRWYAERFGHAIATVESDVAAARLDEPQDVVCAHSLLSCIPVEAHAGVVASWHRLLRPGGVVMMAHALRPGVPGTKMRFSAGQIVAFRKRVSDAVAASPFPLPAAAHIDRMAEDYASRSAASVIRSAEQLTGLLEAAGFELLEVRVGDLTQDPNHVRSGPGDGVRKDQSWIVARRL